MSGVGEAAGIAGLLTFAGQCLKLFTKVHALVKAFNDAVPQAKRLADELLLLQKCANQIRNIASRASSTAPDISGHVEGLVVALARCQNTAEQIERKIQGIVHSSKKFTRTKIKVAAARDFFTQLCAQISSEKQELMFRLATLTCELSLQASSNIEHLATSTTCMEKNIVGIVDQLDGHSASTERHLQALDTKLQSMQRFLEQSVALKSQMTVSVRSKRGRGKSLSYTSHKSRKLEPPGHRASTATSQLVAQCMRVVSPAFLTYEKRGKLYTELVARRATDLDRIDEPQKIMMIRYLQSLRILIWLLRQENYLTVCSMRNLVTSRSPLAAQAGLSYSWQLSTAIDELDTTFGKTDASRYSSYPPACWFKDLSWWEVDSWVVHVTKKALKQRSYFSIHRGALNAKRRSHYRKWASFIGSFCDSTGFLNLDKREARVMTLLLSLELHTRWEGLASLIDQRCDELQKNAARSPGMEMQLTSYGQGARTLDAHTVKPG